MMHEYFGMYIVILFPIKYICTTHFSNHAHGLLFVLLWSGTSRFYLYSLGFLYPNGAIIRFYIMAYLIHYAFGFVVIGLYNHLRIGLRISSRYLDLACGYSYCRHWLSLVWLNTLSLTIGLDIVDKAGVGGKKWISQKWLSNETNKKNMSSQV